MSRRRRKLKRLRTNATLFKRFQTYLRNFNVPKYATIIKTLGETPLEATERLRINLNLSKETPLAYAGRLDPMATGTLLILIGEECKKQTKYHGLDKEYIVELLFGLKSDSGDVLGIIESCSQTIVSEFEIKNVFEKLIGSISLPYPHFSSKTIQGKPLHTWAIEKRLDEISIPIKTSFIHSLTLNSLVLISKADLIKRVHEKVESIPEVTATRKHAGADFRRTDVRNSWKAVAQSGFETYQVLTFTCVASSGSYMRSLAEKIGSDLGTCGLALSIHRTIIGKYISSFKNRGVWAKKY